eukprot:6329060-Amphidinium_carterae.1
MTSATAVVRAGTSLRKRTGEPLDDGHRTLNHFADCCRQFMTMDGSNVPNQPVSTIPFGIAMNPREEEMISCPTS